MDNISEIDKKIEAVEKKYSYASDDIYYFNTHRPASLVRKLQNRINEFDQGFIPDVFAKALGEEIISYDISRFFGTGHVIVFAKTKSGRDLVLRVNHALDIPEYYMDMEKDIVARFKNAGIPSVSILASDTSRKDFPFDYQIMLLLAGKDLENEWQGSQSDYNNISFELGKIIAKQYKIPGVGWGRLKLDNSGAIVGSKDSHHSYLTAYLDHDLEFISLFEFLDKPSVERIREFFDSSALNRLFEDTNQAYFIHHDLADHNIRYDKNHIVAVFDWENTVLFDPISDLGSAPTWATHYPREQKMIDGFIDELGYKPANLESKIAVYFLRTMIWKVQFALKGKRLSARHIDLFKDAAKRNGIQVNVIGEPI